MVLVKEGIALTLCAYCKKLCCHVNNPYLTCELCAKSVHVRCLKNDGQVPGCLLGDVFFKLNCAECSGEELLSREKISWITVAILSLYHLSKTHPSNNGFYHYSKHICDFVENYYTHLFAYSIDGQSASVTKTKNWKGTLAGVLSSYNHSLFKSGFSILGENGWWRLMHDLPPIVIVNERSSLTKTVRKKNKQLAELGTSQIESNPSESSLESADVDVFESSTDQPSTSHGDMYSQAYVEPTEMLSDFLFEEEADEIDIEGDCMEADSFGGVFVCDFSLKEEVNNLLELDGTNSQSESINQEAQKTLPQEIEEASDVDSPLTIKDEIQTESETEDENEDASYVDPAPPPKSLFTILPAEIRTSYPWETHNNDDGNTDPSPVVPMSLFEESQLFERLRRARASHEMPASVSRLYRKLFVRRLKRQRNLPLLNIDCGKATMPREKRKRVIVLNDVRVLDRFQNTSNTRLNRVRRNCPFAVRLTGEFEATNFYSSYTQRLLKAYIRRDMETTPPWLALMQEMQIKANRKNPDWVLPERWPIDYSYVRPQHISSVNSLCKEFFYPDIDLSETLSYPDFTCVALYKKLVVGFAFMVPDSGFNETYISFLFTRPEWRGSGIATFMLYHLIQTCMGKDITLHVSVTNPALLLYQKFGFKIEEYIQDFYEKYFAADSKECKHALYLRLAR